MTQEICAQGHVLSTAHRDYPKCERCGSLPVKDELEQENDTQAESEEVVESSQENVEDTTMSDEQEKQEGQDSEETQTEQSPSDSAEKGAEDSESSESVEDKAEEDAA